MTLIDLSLSDLVRCCSGRVLAVSWSATRARFDGRKHCFDRHRLILQIEMLSLESAMLEAWVESDDALRIIYPRSPVHLRGRFEDEFLHLDVREESGSQGSALARLSFRIAMAENQLELVYAQSSLLSEAQFLAGTYDPPRLSRAAMNQTARSA